MQQRESCKSIAKRTDGIWQEFHMRIAREHAKTVRSNMDSHQIIRY